MAPKLINNDSALASTQYGTSWISEKQNYFQRKLIPRNKEKIKFCPIFSDKPVRRFVKQ